MLTYKEVLRRTRTFLIKNRVPFSIFIVAFLMRVLYNVTVAHNYYPTRDSLTYQTLGFNIIKEHCFCLQNHVSTISRPPLWPFIIALISVILGPSDFYVRLFLCGIGSLTCTMVYLFTRDLFNNKVGIIAGISASIYPLLYVYDGWLYTESLYIFLLFASCYCIFGIQRSSGTMKNWIILGILLGLLSLTRPNGIIIIVLFVAWCFAMLFLKTFTTRNAIRGALVTVLISILIIAPWTLRNYFVTYTFLPVATNEGTVLLGAYNNAMASVGSWDNPLQSAPQISKRFSEGICPPNCELHRESVYQDAALQWIHGHIRSMPYLLSLHILNMWQPRLIEADLPVDRFSNQIPSKTVKIMMVIFPIIVFILAAIGLFLTFRRWRELLFLYIAISFTIGEAIVFYGSTRFRAPIEPILILFASYGFFCLTQFSWKRFFKKL